MYEAGIAGFVANRTQQRDSARRKQEQMNSQGLVEIGLPESPLPQAPAPASVQSRLRIADVPIVPSTAEETPQGVAMSSSADPDALNVTAPEKQDEDGVPVGLPGLALLEQAWGQDQGDSTVHEDIVAGEIALGRSPAEAEEIAEEANTRIATHLGYPAPPVPEKLTEEEGEALTKAIELLLAD